MTYLYTDLADQFVQRIEQGLYAEGERLPGIRSTAVASGVSPATVVAAFRQLEVEGYIDSKPRSGFYVRPRMTHLLPEPQLSKIRSKPEPVTGQEHVLRLLQQLNQPDIVQLGANVPAPSFLPNHAINQVLAKMGRKQSTWTSTYEIPPGLLKLRQAIARRMAELGNLCTPDDILITNGCQEALYLSLKCHTQPGDVVAVESPTYYGLLQIIDALGLKALEIPTDPRDGISISALELALDQWPIRACIISANYSNPLGALMPQDNRRALFELMNKHTDVIVIEDDIYGDLGFEQKRPSPLQGEATSANFIYCSSYSKSLAPGLRIGWIIAKQNQQQLEYAKYVTNCASPTLNQLTVADLILSGKYERHLKKMRATLQQAMQKLSARVHQHFPTDTKITRPKGGMALWVELDKSVSAVDVSQQAIEHGISIAPGHIFSSSGKYQNCIRLTCAVDWNARVEVAIEQLGELVKS